MTTFLAGPIKSPAQRPPKPSMFHRHISSLVHRFKAGQLSLEAFIQLQCDVPLPIGVMRELWTDGSAGPKTRELVQTIWDAFKNQALTVEDLASLVVQPRADPGSRAVRERTALLVAVMETLEDTVFPKAGGVPRVSVRRRVGFRDGKYQTFWMLAREVEKA